jgi:hypothetical protein
MEDHCFFPLKKGQEMKLGQYMREGSWKKICIYCQFDCSVLFSSVVGFAMVK